jgi:nitrous oxidase accessory protein NosD
VVKLAGTCAGVLDTRLVGITKTLTLRGGYTYTNWTTADPAANPTVLDGAGAGRVITATAPVTVENLTIRNGFGTDFFPDAVSVNGGGMYATAAVVVSNTTFVDNRTGLSNANATGGALWAGDAVTIVASRFLTNSAGSAGGAYV